MWDVPVWFTAWKQSADVRQTPDEIVGRLPDGSISDTDTEYTFVRPGRLISFKYRWRIRSGDAGYQVVEHAYVSRIWYLLVAVSYFTATIGSVVIDAVTGFVALISVFATFFALILYSSLLFYFLSRTSPVSELLEEGQNYRRLIPIASLVLVLLLGLVVAYATDERVRYAGIAVVVLSLAGYALEHDRAVAGSFRWQSRLVNQTQKLPMIASNYVTILMISSVPLFVFISSHDQPVFMWLTLAYPIIYPVVYVALTFVPLALIANTVRSAYRIEGTLYRREGRNVDANYAVLATAGTVVLASIVFGYLSYRFIIGSWIAMPLTADRSRDRPALTGADRVDQVLVAPRSPTSS